MDSPVIFLQDAPEAADTSWVQAAKIGTFNDPRYGTFRITAADFSKWIANFERFALSDGHLGLPVDVDHSPEKKGDTEAYGWVKQLEKRANELWARVEWNPAGKELVAERRYAYISPSYSPDFKDEGGQSHGTALVGIALTNRPFLQMATVNLSKDTFTFAAKSVGDNDPDDRGGKSDNDADDQGLPASEVTELDSEPMDMDALLPHMLDITDAARKKHAVVVKKVGGTTKHMFPVPPGDHVHARAALALLPRAIAAGHITPSEAAAIRGRAHEVLGGGGKQHSAYNPDRDMELDTILTTLGLTRADLSVAADADEPTVLTALAAHQAKDKPPEVPPGHMVLSADTVANLQAQAAAGAAAAEDLRVTKFEGAFTLAQEAGKVVLAQKESFREMFDLNGEKTLKLLDGLQPVVNMSPAGHGVGPTDLSPEIATLASTYTDVVTPMGIDTEGLKKVAAAEQISLAKNVSFERALEMVDAGVTA